MARTKWYKYSTSEAIAEFDGSVETGLTNKQVEAARETFGTNKLEASGGISPFKLFFNQFKDALLLVLIISAVVSFALSLIGPRPADTADTISAKIASQIECDRFKVRTTLELRFTDQYCNDPTSICTSDIKQMVQDLCQKYEEVADAGKGPEEALLILAIVLSIALIGFLNEYKAEKTVEALKKLIGEDCLVRRDGKKLSIPAIDLVPGDIVFLSEGAKIPADIRIIVAKSFLVNESSLTGESLPVEKHADTLKNDLSLGDQRNMAFSGTFVAQGTAEGVVVATGQSTELGRIASLVANAKEELTPMQRKLDDLGRKIGLMILGICMVMFVLILVLVEEAQELQTASRIAFALTAAVALAVAAIPEGLAFVVRISLALGARRMASKNALVRTLSAVEALGSTDIICTDKTGTLTKGEMTVRECTTIGGTYTTSGLGYGTRGQILRGSKPAKSHALDKLLLVGALCNNAGLRGKDAIIGDPTEASLLVSSDKYHLNYQKVQKEFIRVDEIPFNSQRKKMTTIHNYGTRFFIASKGAAENILESCDRYITDDGFVIKLDTKTRNHIMQLTDEMSSRALRVLGFAYSELRSLPKTTSNTEKGLIFAGLQGIIDPPRKEVVRVIGHIQRDSGMRVMMITGDYIETAKAIAKEIGILGEAVSGADIDRLSDTELRKAVETTSVFARVDPEHKIRIVRALQANGHQVAMTGDGVNDAPAIRAADIGIAMGITGTDASKEAADLILLDDQFLTIIEAIQEGRGIYVNLRRFLNLLLSANAGKVLTVLMGVVFFNNLILSAAQLLFINILSDGLPAVALGADSAPKKVLKSSPSEFRSSILSMRMFMDIVIFGIAMSILLLLHFRFVDESHGFMAATSAVFLGAIVYGLARLVSIRLKEGLASLFTNKSLVIASLSSILCALCVMYIEPLANNFGIQPVRAIDWYIIGAGSLLLIVFMKITDRLLDTIEANQKAKA